MSNRRRVAFEISDNDSGSDSRSHGSGTGSGSDEDDDAADAFGVSVSSEYEEETEMSFGYGTCTGKHQRRGCLCYLNVFALPRLASPRLAGYGSCSWSVLCGAPS